MVTLIFRLKKEQAQKLLMEDVGRHRRALWFSSGRSFRNTSDAILLVNGLSVACVNKQKRKKFRYLSLLATFEISVIKAGDS